MRSGRSSYIEASYGGCMVGEVLVRVAVGVGCASCGGLCSSSVGDVCVVSGAVVVVAVAVATRMS